MSWVFGFISNHPISLDDKIRFETIHSSCLYKFENEQSYIAGGGIHQTCLFKKIDDHKGYLVLGMGMAPKNDTNVCLSPDDWEALIRCEKIPVEKLNGHFVIIRWNNHVLECFSDSLGLRAIYVAQTKTGIVFSTRLDWTAKIKKDCQLNKEAFGSHWLGFNQISTKSLLRGIERTGQSGYVKIASNKIIMEGKPWLPKPVGIVNGQLENELKKYLTLISDRGSLGLSGGLDSRVLLSLLLNSGQRNFNAHVFGSPEHPDVAISKKISEDLDVSFTNYNYQLPAVDKCIELIEKYTAQTLTIGPASSSFNIQYYQDLHRNNKIMIDGGFGEIARRQFFNRLLIRGRKALYELNTMQIPAYLKITRAPIFTRELNDDLHKGFICELEAFLKEMPKIDQIGEENFLDLWAVRSRLPNFYGIEQSRLDQEIVNFMPFAQPSILNIIFNISVKKRKGRKLFRDIIKSNYASLNRYDLAGSNSTYPFYLGTIGSHFWIKIKSAAGLRYRDNSKNILFDTIKEYVYDIVNSNQVKTFGMYDYAKVKRVVEGYYSGQKDLVDALDWWLSFEMWRRSVGLN